MSVYADLKNKAYEMGGFNYEPIKRRQATIVAFNPINRTCSIKLANSPITIEDCGYIDSYFPVTGETVWCDIKGCDILVVGTLEGVWIPYTAPLTAMSPGTQQARYKRRGQTCHFNFTFHWSGASAHGVVFALQLPFYHTPMSEETTGSMKFIDGATGRHIPGVCFVLDAQPFLFFVGPNGIVSGNFGLGATVVNDSWLTATITYEVSLGA